VVLAATTKKQPGWIAEAEKDLLINPSRYKNAIQFKTYQTVNRGPLFTCWTEVSPTISVYVVLAVSGFPDTELSLQAKMNDGTLKSPDYHCRRQESADLNYDTSAIPPSFSDVLT